MEQKKRLKLSVVLAVFNEAGNLDRCLSSVKNIAEEIIVVDGGSDDDTIKIALSYGAKIIKTENPKIFHINKQKALDAATGEWIFQLDADEEVSAVLASEINNVINMSDKELYKYQIPDQKKKLFLRHQSILEARDGSIGKKSGVVTAFFIPRLNYFLGKPIKYAGTYPDGVIRLFKKGLAWFPAQSVHEQIKINGRASWLLNDLYHYSNPTLNKYWQNADKYTSLLSEEFSKNKLSKNVINYLFYNTIKPIDVFFNLYIRHKGIFDGWRGLLFSFFSALHYPVAFKKYIKLK